MRSVSIRAGPGIQREGETLSKTQENSLYGPIRSLGRGFPCAAVGGWDAAFVTLLIFMGIDYVTGLPTV